MYIIEYITCTYGTCTCKYIHNMHAISLYILLFKMYYSATAFPTRVFPLNTRQLSTFVNVFTRMYIYIYVYLAAGGC